MKDDPVFIEEVVYGVEDFLEDSMDFVRNKLNKITHLHPAQKRVVWEELIHEIEDEKNG